jgi:hypothetical protein
MLLQFASCVECVVVLATRLTSFFHQRTTLTKLMFQTKGSLLSRLVLLTRTKAVSTHGISGYVDETPIVPAPPKLNRDYGHTKASVYLCGLAKLELYQTYPNYLV